MSTRFKELTKLTEEKAVKLRRIIDSQKNEINHMMEEFKKRSDYAFEQNRLKFNSLHNEIEKDRQYLQSRLMHMDDTTVIQKWVQGEIQSAEIKLRNEYKMEFRRLNYKMDKVWNENLLVPELIGENEICLYKNMSEYCKGLKIDFDEFRFDFEKRFTSLLE